MGGSLASVKQAAFNVGDVLGRYVIEGVLGFGGMGIVFRAHDPELDRRVALKVLRPRKDQDAAAWADAKARLLREARAAAALSHAAIVTIFDIGEVDGLPFLAMELIEGQTLRALASGPVRIALDVALTWLGSLADALAAAHRVGIVHRDVKPENVMIRVDGQLKLLDLGIARTASMDLNVADTATRSTPQLPSLTGEGMIVGTVTYMSPEQVRCDALDGRADQFAWGVVAYELLARRLPWSGRGDPMAVVASIVAEEPRPLVLAAPDVPPKVAVIVMRALAKAKEARFPTMDDLSTAWTGARERASAAAVTPADLAAPPSEIEPATERWTSSPKPHPAPESVADRRAPVPARATRRRRLAWAVFGGALILPLLIASALYAIVHGRPHETPVAASPAGSSSSASSTSAPRVVRLRDQARPSSSSPLAIEAYDQGIGEESDGVNSAPHAFERALALEPTLVAADLRLCVHELQFSAPEDQDSALEHYRHALAGRGRLTPRDHSLVEVLAPIIVQQPKDWDAGEAGLRRLVNAAPGDIEIETLLGHILALRGKTDDARVVFEHLRSMDPNNVDAAGALAELARLGGALDEARKLSQGCVDANPRATSCLEGLLDVDIVEGKCADVEQLAHRFIATTPDDVWGYIYLFESEVAEGVPRASLDTTLARLLAHAPDASRKWAHIRYPWLLAVWSGNFVRAEELLTDELALAVREGDLEDELYVERDRSALALEVGSTARAARAAEAYLEKKRASPPPGSPSRDTLARDATPTALMTLRRTGRLSAEAAEAKRAAWLAEWTARMTPDAASSLWVEAYARAAETRADAESALLHAPPGVPRLLAGDLLESEAIGRVYFLAGKATDAIPFLERAANACSTRKHPFAIPKARYFLGLALEQTGNVKGACQAYRHLLDVWGTAKPRSVTAELARGRASALHCGG